MAIEQDWTTAAGLPARAIRTKFGYRCGYVGVPKSFAMYGIWADMVLAGGETPKGIFGVHGFITYSGNSWAGSSYTGEGHSTKETPGDPEYWWLGFDCSRWAPDNDGSQHDAFDYEIVMDKQGRRRRRRIARRRKLPYVIEQCEDLAQRLVNRETRLTLNQRTNIYNRKIVYLDGLGLVAPT